MKFLNNFLGIRLKGVTTFRHSGTLRLLHWVLAPSFLALMWSGFYLNKPSRIRGFHSMDLARKTHFMAQYFFGFYYLARVYYALVKQDYRSIIPGREDMAALPEFTAYELFLQKKKPRFPRYNPLQKLLYTQMALLFPLQMVTGAALYSTGRLQKLSRLFGGLNNVRLAHYLAAAGLSGMAMGHLYFAVTDSVEKLKSIFTGYFKPK